MPREASRAENAAQTRRTLLAFTPAIVVLLVGLVAFDAERHAQVLNTEVTHARNVVDVTASTVSALQDAETGQRGFVITGKPAYLAPYTRAMVALRSDTIALRTLLSGDREQASRLDSLDGLVTEKQRELAETIRARRDVGFAAAQVIIARDSGKMTMDSIRALLSRFDAHERAALEVRRASEASHRAWARVSLAIGTILAVLISLLINRMLVRYADRETLIARELADRNQLLEDQGVELETQSLQLQEQAVELEMQNEELQTSTDALVEQRRVAETANRAKTDFLAMMSHELRTPLNAIAGYAQLMQLGVPEPIPETYQRYLERIQQSQAHLLGIINSVLNFARLEAGTIAYDIENVPVRRVLTTMEALIAPQVAARALHYECGGADDALVIRADEEKVTQILLNLLSNAIKFTPPGGTIAVSSAAAAAAAAADRDDERPLVTIRVRDTGPGIAPEMLESIFDPFVQVDTSRTRNAEGTGLGLAIARELARHMGGDLACESVIGEGATFTLTLPSAAGEPAISQRPPAAHSLS